MKRSGWLLSLALLGAACSDSTAPVTGSADSELQFVRFPATPPVETLQKSFWAVRGENRELVIRYLPDEVGDEGHEFLEFRVSDESLLRRPDGTAFAEGDSIEITVTLSNDGRFLFDFQPSGLVFDPDEPARLKITYRGVDDDLDGDSDVDDDDADLESRMRVWKQERAGEPWFPLGTLKVEDFDEIEGEITGFTGFCIAGRRESSQSES